MMDADLQKTMSNELEKELARPKLVPPSKIATVTADIEALKAKLDVIIKGVNILKDQL